MSLVYKLRVSVHPIHHPTVTKAEAFYNDSAGAAPVDDDLVCKLRYTQSQCSGFKSKPSECEATHLLDDDLVYKLPGQRW
jgi:hypothetical protein